MSFDGKSESAVFAEDGRAVLFRREHAGTGIVVHVVNVAASAIRPTGGAVDETRGVELSAKIDNARRVELSPTFVEGNPHNDAGEEVERVEHLAKFDFIVCDGFRRAFRVGRIAADVVRRVAAGHILPDEHSKLVARVIVTRRFDLDVLAEHVETEGLQNLEVVDHALFGRRRVETVRPPALIERTVLEDKLVVEHHAGNTVLVLAKGGLAHRVVGADRVDRFAAELIKEGNGDIVERRVVGSPEFIVLRGNRDGSFTGDDLRRVFVDDDKHAFGVIRFDVDLDCHVVDIGDRANLRNVRLRNRFKPNGLPDARNRRVPNAVRVVELFADALNALVRGVPDLNDEFLLAFRLDGAGQIDREGAVSALMAADFDVVEEDVGAPIDGAELEQNLLAGPIGGNIERRLIPQVVLRADGLRDAGERGFRAERDENLPLSRFELFADRQNRVVPKTVQVDPTFAGHLRTRILGQRLIRFNVFRELGEKDSFRRLPLGGGSGRKGAPRDGDADEKSDGSEHERLIHRLPFSRGGNEPRRPGDNLRRDDDSRSKLMSLSHNDGEQGKRPCNRRPFVILRFSLLSINTTRNRLPPAPTRPRTILQRLEIFPIVSRQSRRMKQNFHRDDLEGFPAIQSSRSSRAETRRPAGERPLEYPTTVSAGFQESP